MEVRFCKDPCCDKMLNKRPDEKLYNFRKREYCDKSCAATHSGEIGKKNTNNNFYSTVTKSLGYGLQHLNADMDPDICHCIPGLKSIGCNPVPKTQDEIDRMWEYNRMMGRR